MIMGDFSEQHRIFTMMTKINYLLNTLGNQNLYASDTEFFESQRIIHCFVQTLYKKLEKFYYVMHIKPELNKLFVHTAPLPNILTYYIVQKCINDAI
jgi:hypothetical protein